MPTSTKPPYTLNSTNFDPDDFLARWTRKELSAPANDDNDFESAIKRAFDLPAKDSYVYHATASVTLAQVRRAIGFGAQHGLHAWYRDEHGKETTPPPSSDITAYTSIFSSTTSTAKSLTSYHSNAKKNSHRHRISTHLLSHRLFPDTTLQIPKLKPQHLHINPYLDFWAWSCHNLEWAGPDADTVTTRQSHHILPIFYHHFGCLCPSYESLIAIQQLSQGRSILDLGSGNGYWTFMLRRLGCSVTAVDNGDSLWRTMWIGDTINQDGAAYLSKNDGAKDAVLLLVYPQVTTPFTVSVLKGYKGSTICIAGTQNRNGFTAFKDVTIEEYLQKEASAAAEAGGGGEHQHWRKIVQTPLPSFAGKDEALFVFERSSLGPVTITSPPSMAAQAEPAAPSPFP